MRLFVGVELSEDVRAAAAAVAERMRQRLKTARVDVTARWVAPENLHITLWFIGEVNDERAQAIDRALAPQFAVAPFELALGGCGAFPPAGPPRVFWIGLRRGAEPIGELSREVAARLSPPGDEPERRAYSAHVTIARVKDVPRGSAAAIRGLVADIPASAGSCRVEFVTLFRSHLSPKGSTYEPLARVPLQA